MKLADHKTDTSIHAEMLVQTTDGPVSHDGKFFSPSTADSLVSTDPKEIKEFFAGQCLTAGFSIQFAINPETHEVVHVMRKGRLIQRDAKALIAQGFSEWTFSWCWSPGHFRFPDGGIVKVSRKIDASPVATTRHALRFAGAFGL